MRYRPRCCTRSSCYKPGRPSRHASAGQYPARTGCRSKLLPPKTSPEDTRRTRCRQTTTGTSLVSTGGTRSSLPRARRSREHKGNRRWCPATARRIPARTPCRCQGSSSQPPSKRCRSGRDCRPSPAGSSPACIPWAAGKTQTGRGEMAAGARPRTAPRADSRTSGALRTMATSEVRPPRTRRSASAGAASMSGPPCHPGSAGSILSQADTR